MNVQGDTGLPEIGPDGTIAEAVAVIDESGKGIVLVVDEDRRLVSTITDGDVRRAVLAGIELASPVGSLLEGSRPAPVTARVGTSDAELLRVMTEGSLRHVPLLGDDGRVVGLAVLGDLVKNWELPLEAVIMAGGFGTRLGEMTKRVPKPMLPVGDRPLLEQIIGRLRDAGIRSVHVTTHYHADQIADHFGDGSRFGVDIRYVTEDEPLGTAGALGLLEGSDVPLLVMNGDLVTGVDFRSMLHFHEDQQADMTIAVRPYEIRVSYGMVELDAERIRDVVEKPLVSGFVNAGIYLLNREVCRHVPAGTRYDMTDLIRRALASGLKVVGFPLREHWLDIGQIDDYERALAQVASQA